jgi:hypothetical protein
MSDVQLHKRTDATYELQRQISGREDIETGWIESRFVGALDDLFDFPQFLRATSAREPSRNGPTHLFEMRSPPQERCPPCSYSNDIIDHRAFDRVGLCHLIVNTVDENVPLLGCQLHCVSRQVWLPMGCQLTLPSSSIGKPDSNLITDRSDTHDIR